MVATVLKDVSLIPYNSFRLDSKASLMAFPYDNDSLRELIDTYGDKKRIIVRGKGTKVIFSKKLYSEDYLFINLKLMDNIQMEKPNRIKVQGGAKLSDLVWFAIENNIKILSSRRYSWYCWWWIIMNAGTHKNTIGKFTKL